MPKLKVVYQTTNMGEATFMKSLLEGNDIACVFQDEHMAGLFATSSFAFGGIKIVVDEKDFECAQDLIKQHERRNT